uniref:Uncharacterized protein n=1 Tax=Onchocerca volvulus TaxID=6282 RepID=A0A8R1TUB6_ONCVO
MAVIFTGDLPSVLLRIATKERYFWDLKRKIIVYMWEGSEDSFVNVDIFYRTLSNMSHSLQLWRQIEHNYSKRFLNKSAQLMTHINGKGEVKTVCGKATHG